MIRFLVFSGLFLASFALEGRLKLGEVKPVVEEMLSLHVDHKEFSKIVARRSLRNYIYQFDQEEKYLLLEEVKPFFEPRDKELSLMIKEFDEGHFSRYFLLNKTITQSIQRARKMRALIKTELLKKKEFSPSSQKRHTFYKTSEELYEGIKSEMEESLIAYLNIKGVSDLDLEERLKVIDFYEKKKREHEEEYLEKYDQGEEKISFHIVKAIASSLDPHTTYFNPEEARVIKAKLQKELFGVGISLKETIDGPEVTKIIGKSVADRSGTIQKGDILLQVGGEEVKGLYFRDVLLKLEGKEGSKCNLVVKHSDGKVEHVSLIREKIVLDEERITIDYEPFGEGIIGKINLPSFYDNGKEISLEKDLREALRELKSEKPLLGLVLDLRKNAGGFLQQAIKTASLFMYHGIVVIAKYAGNKVEYTRPIDPRTYYKGPLILLTSKASASSAEILAQALKDEGVALIVGDDRTYGKGSMQYQTITLPSPLHFFKVTVGRYFTMSGKSTQMEGVAVDIEVPTKYAPYNIGERFLRYPIPGEAMSKASDVGQGLKNLFDRYTYRKKTSWEAMIPQLSLNSKKRLEKDLNFQLFLGEIEKAKGEGKREKVAYGSADLQMKEAVNILKDMIFLQKNTLSEI